MARTRPTTVTTPTPTVSSSLPAYNSAMTAAGKPIFPNRKMVIAYDSRQAEAWCVDEATEILTQRGWLHREHVSRDDLVYTLNHEDGTAGWEPILDMATFDVVDEPMLLLKVRHHSSLTTMAHRWPVIRQTYAHANRKLGSSNRAHRERAWTTSAELYAEDQLVTAAPCRDLPAEAKYSDAFVELVAWFWTEGAIRPNRTNPSISIYQSESANPGYVARIQRALTQIFGEPNDGSHRGQTRDVAGWRKVVRAGDSGAVVFKLNVAASEELLRVAPGKVVSLEFLRELTESQLRLFLDVSVMADGTVGVTPLIYQKNPAMLDPYLFACVMAGLTPHVWLTKSDSEWSLGNDKWRATALPRSVATPRRKRNRSVESYTGKVWCPVTPSGTWMARRNGTVWFTGNTAWDREGELYTLTEWLSNMVSRCRLVIAEVNEGDDEPTIVESGPAVDALNRLGGGAGGQSQLLQEAATHLSVAGIGWLVGEQPDDGIPDSPDFERWVILSADEIRPARRKIRGEPVFEIREENGENENVDAAIWRPLSPDSMVVRFWRPHPRQGWRPDSPTMHALGALLELDLINKRIIATILSRLASNGILLFDEGRLSIPDQGPAGEGIEAINNFAKLLVDVAGRGIADPASPEATIPIPIGWSAQDMEGFDPKLLMQHITFGDSVSPELIAQRDSAVERVSRTMPVSPERLTGMGTASHWGASQIEESDVKSYVAPTVELIAHSWTVGFLYPLLKAGGAELTGPGGGRLIIWYDPSAITAKADKSKSALDAYDRFEASGAALRRETGLDDEDAPAPNELVEMMIKRIARENPALMAAALVELGGPELVSTVTAPSTNVVINRPGRAPAEVPVDPAVPDTQGDDAPDETVPAPTRAAR